MGPPEDGSARASPPPVADWAARPGSSVRAARRTAARETWRAHGIGEPGGSAVAASPTVTRLSDAPVLITGGSSGIGLETARQALTRGARVSIVARDVDRLRAALDDLEAAVGDTT